TTARWSLQASRARAPGPGTRRVRGVHLCPTGLRRWRSRRDSVDFPIRMERRQLDPDRGTRVQALGRRARCPGAVLLRSCPTDAEPPFRLRATDEPQERIMCRNIRTLFNFEPPVTDDEIRAASLQFVRKVSGFSKPSKANEAAFQAAVDAVAAASRNLLDAL